MATYDKRITALESDVATMKQHFIEKLDETNRSVTIIAGVISSQGRDIKTIKTRLDLVDLRLDRVEMRLGSIDQRLDHMDTRFDGIDQRLDKMDARIDGLTDQVGGLTERVDGLTEEVRAVKNQQEQHGEKLDAILALLQSGR